MYSSWHWTKFFKNITISGNQVGSRFEYDSIMIKTKNNRNDISVDVKTLSTDGIIFFAHQSDGTDFMAIYLIEGKVI